MALIDKINLVKEFHEAFQVGNAEIPTAKLSQQDISLRHRLQAEENEEYLSACKDENLTEIADALGDQLYILFGTILKHGLQNKIEEVFDEIHRSNMSKLDKDGKPIFREDGKVMKSDQYFKPNIQEILIK